MRILVLSYFYLPDGGPAAPLFGMLCEELALRGHEVTVLASTPHYPSGRVQPAYQGKWLQRSRENGVNVVRVRVPSVNRSDLKMRLLQFAVYQLGTTWAGWRERYDVVLVPNPALVFCVPFTFLATLRGKPVIFSVHDIYPDVGVKLGIFSNRLVIATVGWLESFYMKRSKYVRILSDSFILPLLSMGVPRNKMVLIYDWVDTDLVKPLPRDNRFSREHGLNDDFVALYAGNVGFSQGLENVLTAAELLQGHKDIKFVLLGEGAGRDHLMAQAKERRLENVKFLPFQPRSRLPEVLATADVSLVTLKKGIGTASLPSKCFSILASGRPLIASVDEDSDTWKLVQRSGAGVCILPENPQALAKAIMALKDDPSRRKLLGRHGREFALHNHSPQAAAEKFEKLLLAAISTH
jgi:colanic acid biosynthesis glycosyl transferase WcaI